MTKKELIEEYQEAVKTEKIHKKIFGGSSDTDDFSGLYEDDFRDQSYSKIAREAANTQGDRTQFWIDNYEPRNGAEAAYLRQLQRQHDYKGRGAVMQKQLAVDNNSSKGDRKK